MAIRLFTRIPGCALALFRLNLKLLLLGDDSDGAEYEEGERLPATVQSDSPARCGASR